MDNGPPLPKPPTQIQSFAHKPNCSALQVGVEPTLDRLTADCFAIKLLKNDALNLSTQQQELNLRHLHWLEHSDTELCCAYPEENPTPYDTGDRPL